MSAPTKKDWGKIHAKAWRDPYFRELLEQDPKAAIELYAKVEGKKFSQVVKLGPKPSGVDDDKLHEHEDALVPPACC